MQDRLLETGPGQTEIKEEILDLPARRCVGWFGFRSGVPQRKHFHVHDVLIAIINIINMDKSNTVVDRSPGVSHEMTYHYVGKVHVRGLLRRVWRPRYLALGDDGYLRYHESLPPLYQQDQPHPNRLHNPRSSLSTTNASHDSHTMHTHRPKSILKILDGARTIDPHSVVDQHVALPEGVFGFVFRGRAVELHPTNSKNGKEGIDFNNETTSHTNDDCVVIVPNECLNDGSNATKPLSTSKQMVNLVFPKGTARRGIAQKIAKQAINPDVLCGFGRANNCDGGMSRSSSSSSFFDENGHDDAHDHGVTSNNKEWGHSSYGSHETLCSFQEVRRHVDKVRDDVDGMRARKSGQNGFLAHTPSTNQFQVQTASIQSREYLCAVSTSEEAESWVVALRWAAEHRRRRKYGTRTEVSVSGTSAAASSRQDNDGKPDGMPDKGLNTVKSTIPKRKGCCGEDTIVQQGRDEEHASRLESTNAARANSVKESKTTMKIDSPTSSHRPSTTSATIVVTKVSALRLPTNLLMHHECKNHGTGLPPLHFPLPGDDLVIYYEIQLLLLKHCKTLNDAAIYPESVEERTIMKSIPDILAFVHDLKDEFSSVDNKKKNNYVPHRVSDESLFLLEDVKSELLACLESCIKLRSSQQTSYRSSMILNSAMAEIFSSFTEVMASVGKVDRVMRKLSKDSRVCSSHRFQEFLFLHAQHTATSKSPVTATRKSSQVVVSNESDAEQIVRSWLSKSINPSTRTKVNVAAAIAARHRAVGPMFSLIVTWSICRFASIFWLIISGSGIIVNLPFETYATLIAIVFYFGHNQGLSLRHNNEMRFAGVKKSEELQVSDEGLAAVGDDHSTVADEEDSESDDDIFTPGQVSVSSPLPLYPANSGTSCWSIPDHQIFMVRSTSYFEDRVKVPSAPAVFQCRGVDVWITDNAERNIARHPSVLGGKLHREHTFVVNFLLPFSNFVAYFTVPPIEDMPVNIAKLWTEFIRGDQQFRDGKLKLLPVVVDGPWIVKKAVGPGTSPAMVGRDLPLQYYFTEPTATKKGVYEVDVLVTASRIARGILNVVKGHTKSLTMAFAFIIEASEESQLPETVLCSFQVHSLHLEECPNLPDCYPDG